MKIAMIGQKGIPALSGGVEQHVDVLARLLTERGHQVTVYCRRSYCGDDLLATHHSPFASLEWPRRIFRPSVPTKHLDAIAHSVTSTFDALFRDVDLVHYHAIGPAALAPLARLRGLPTVVTCHGLDWQRAKWGGIAKRCLRLGEWLAARCASHLVVVSQPLRDYFANVHGVASTYIPNGVVPIERRAPNRIKQWDLRPGQYLLAASRLVPEKGLHYLIPAFESLDTDLKLVIAGGGGLELGYEQALRRMAGPRVVFTGDADRELMGELYSNTLLFLLPSELEGMSIALLEAMSCGLPVVVSDIPENVCVIGEDGFTFRNRDTDHLREVLASLLEHRDVLPEIGARCRLRTERFRWPQIATELEAVYRSVVEGHPMEPGIPVETDAVEMQPQTETAISEVLEELPSN